MNKKNRAVKKIDHLAIRLPNWLGDICMALPALTSMQKKIKETNPEAKFTLFVQKQYITLLRKTSIEGNIVALPNKSWDYYIKFLAWCWKFDAFVLFTNSERGDLEAWITRSKKRYGIARTGKPRGLITDKYTLSEGFDEQTTHQSKLWSNFLGSFDLIGAVDYSPVISKKTNLCQVGLICGSSNAPEKRWPIESWQALIVELIKRYDEVVLIGTKDDAMICDQIKSKFMQTDKVKNIAGKTKLDELVDIMCHMQLVIGNDTGGLHVANAIGVPVVGLYGTTNAIRCQPIFKAPVVVLESVKGFERGSMADISVDSVLKGVFDAESCS